MAEKEKCEVEGDAQRDEAKEGGVGEKEREQKFLHQSRCKTTAISGAVGLQPELSRAKPSRAEPSR